MDADEREICMYLRSYPGQFVGRVEIARRAGGKWRFREDPNWPLPVLARLVDKGLVESDATGHYRLRPEHEKAKANKRIPAQVRAILKESGKDSSGVLEIAETDQGDAP